MSVESFNACVYLLDRQVQSGPGDRLDALPKAATGKVQRAVVREVVARRLAKPGR